ncbi:MAG: type IV toxin-antitoxin system AbiEi family antitoxin domain-containing protein [Solirubrobacteraceae bacterium]
MAPRPTPIAERPLSERAFVALNRSALAAGRHPVVRLAEDVAALDRATGSRRRSQDALRQLSRDGRLRHVRRGVYLLVAPTGSADARLLPLIDAVTARPYLITAGRALAELGLTDQHFFGVIVLSSHRLNDWSWQGDEVRYALLAPERIWGASAASEPQVASPERAILDSLANPRWGVSVAQAAEAIDHAVPQHTSPKRLAEAAERYGSAATARRLGYLLELLHGPAAAEDLLPLRGASHAHVLLSPGAPARGPSSPRWRLRINVYPEALLAHRSVG